MSEDLVHAVRAWIEHNISQSERLAKKLILEEGKVVDAASHASMALAYRNVLSVMKEFGL